jgi:hypothetical protein
MNHWTDDPLERTRFVDGEMPSDERALRARELLANPAARARVDHDARLAALVRASGDVRPLPAPDLEARVRAALARDRRAWGRPAARRALAIAASVLVAGGAAVFAFRGEVPESAAAGREVRLAVEALRRAEMGTLPGGPSSGGSCEEGVASPHRFPLVVNGEAAVESCSTAEHETVSVLRRDDDPTRRKGLVVVPWDGLSSATDVGWTRVEDMVVFDVAIGRAKYYLAARWDGLAGTPACVACHGPARASNPARNPHHFVEREPVRADLAR